MSRLIAALLLCLAVAAGGHTGAARAQPAPAAVVRLGDFSLAPGVKPGLGGGMAVNTVRFGAPDRSFPLLLRQEVAVALGFRQGEAAAAVLSADILQGHAIMQGGYGQAALAAEFVVTRDGTEVFRKRLEVVDTWKRAMMGGAHEAGVHFGQLFSRLAEKLANDPDFKAAVG